MKTTYTSIGVVRSIIEDIPEDALVKTVRVTKNNEWVTADGKPLKHKQTITTITITQNEVT
jgi:hypothetical protein